MINAIEIKEKGHGKKQDRKKRKTVRPVTCHEGTERDWRYSSIRSLTSALGRKGGQRHSLPLYARERDPVPILHKDGWAPGPVCRDAENLAATAFEPRPLQPVASRCTHYALQPTKERKKKKIIEGKTKGTATEKGRSKESFEPVISRINVLNFTVTLSCSEVAAV